MNNTRLVYSTHPDENRRCDRCGEVLAECRCRPDAPVDKSQVVGVLRLEKAGRGGKAVTVIDQLPPNEAFLRELAGKLKRSCGCGGTSAVVGSLGRVEIQGDKRDQLRPLLAREGIRCKG